jgi:hypothetical protein
MNNRDNLMSHTLTKSDDLTAAGMIGKLERELARGHRQIEEVQRCSTQPDENLPVSRNGIRMDRRTEGVEMWGGQFYNFQLGNFPFVV